MVEISLHCSTLDSSPSWALSDSIGQLSMLRYLELKDHGNCPPLIHFRQLTQFQIVGPWTLDFNQ